MDNSVAVIFEAGEDTVERLRGRAFCVVKQDDAFAQTLKTFGRLPADAGWRGAGLSIARNDVDGPNADIAAGKISGGFRHVGEPRETEKRCDRPPAASLTAANPISISALMSSNRIERMLRGCDQVWLLIV